MGKKLLLSPKTGNSQYKMESVTIIQLQIAEVVKVRRHSRPISLKLRASTLSKGISSGSR